MGLFDDQPLPPTQTSAEVDVRVSGVELELELDSWRARVAAEVTSADGHPVEKATVAVFYNGSRCGEGTTDDWGTATIRTTPLGPPIPRDATVTFEVRVKGHRARTSSEGLTIPILVGEQRKARGERTIKFSSTPSINVWRTLKKVTFVVFVVVTDGTDQGVLGEKVEIFAQTDHGSRIAEIGVLVTDHEGVASSMNGDWDPLTRVDDLDFLSKLDRDNVVLVARISDSSIQCSIPVRIRRN